MPKPEPLPWDSSSPTSLSPELRQVFYIGDGRLGYDEPAAAPLTFTAPDGAQKLFLGVADSDYFVGTPSFYGDNHGTFTVDVRSIDAIACDGFYEPMDGEAVTVRGRHRALPIKAQLFDADGYGVSDIDIPSPPLVHIQHEYYQDGDLIIEDVSEDAVSVGLATEGNEFVYLGEGLWQYILKTSNYTGEGIYVITMKAGSPDYVIEPTCEATFVRQQ